MTCLKYLSQNMGGIIMDNILEVKNLNKDFEKFKLRDINLELKKGYIMGFIGPNGAGKTTLIKLIMNLIKKDSGSIKIFGKDNIANEREIKERIGFVYDENYFYEDLSIENMKKLIAPFYKSWDEALFSKHILNFGLDRSMKIKDLSKGGKMKFSLSLALSHDADLIIMDEPTSGLDPIARREFLDILYEIIQNEEKSIFFSTHITTDLEKIADYISFINKGEIVFSKELDDIYKEYSLIKGEDLTDDIISKAIGIRENKFGFEALIRGSNISGEFIVERPTLEDIMYFHIKGKV